MKNFLHAVDHLMINIIPEITRKKMVISAILESPSFYDRKHGSRSDILFAYRALVIPAVSTKVKNNLFSGGKVFASLAQGMFNQSWIFRCIILVLYDGHSVIGCRNPSILGTKLDDWSRVYITIFCVSAARRGLCT